MSEDALEAARAGLVLVQLSSPLGIAAAGAGTGTSVERRTQLQRLRSGAWSRPSAAVLPMVGVRRSRDAALIENLPSLCVRGERYDVRCASHRSKSE